MKTLFSFITLFPISVDTALSAENCDATEIGSDRQLFIGPFDEYRRDRHLIESMKNVEITMNPAHVTGERLVVDRFS